MKPLQSYDSYRGFIKDRFRQEKESSRKTTLTQYARSFNMSAPALNMILSGDRQLTLENVHKMARALRLTREEHEYFEALVLRDQSRDPVARAFYSRRLKLLAKKIPVRNVRLDEPFLVRHWYAPALMIYLLDFERKGKALNLPIDAAKIAEKFAVDKKEVEAVLEKMMELEILTFDSDAQMHLMFDRVATHVPQKNYVKMIAAQLSARLESDFTDVDSIFRALAFTMRRDQLHELRSEVLGVFEKYMDSASRDPDQNILLQGLLGIFPVFRSF